MDIGKKIAELRIEQGMTQESLARKLAVSRELVSKWELGQRRPDFATIRRIAEVFGVSPDDIADMNGLVFAELDECLPEGVSLPRERLAEILNAELGSMKPAEAGIFLRHDCCETADPSVTEGKQPVFSVMYDCTTEGGIRLLSEARAYLIDGERYISFDDYTTVRVITDGEWLFSYMLDYYGIYSGKVPANPN